LPALFCRWVFLRWALGNYMPRAGFELQYLCLLSSWDYRREPLAPGLCFKI
jgi:hypothetical protein